jgi:hypothetical protein
MVLGFFSDAAHLPLQDPQIIQDHVGLVSNPGLKLISRDGRIATSSLTLQAHVLAQIELAVHSKSL